MSDNKLHGTERLNETAKNVHAASVIDNLRVINAQNARVSVAVEQAIPAIEKLVTVAIEKIKTGGRVCYIGAGTSGRLGVLDASECPPTYSVSPEMIQGIIAGGDSALRMAGEGAEDDPALGIKDTLHLTHKDILIGISASGSAVYVRAAIQEGAQARNLYRRDLHRFRCTVIEGCRMPILAPTEPEIPAGSTRMFPARPENDFEYDLYRNHDRPCKVYAGYMIDVKTSNIKTAPAAP